MSNMKKKMQKRLLAMLLSVMMIITMLPVGTLQASAETPNDSALLDIPETDYSVTGYEGRYDSDAHSISVVADGYTVKYSEDGNTYGDEVPSITNVGEKTVYVQLSKEGYNTLTLEVSSKITAATRTDFAFADSSPVDMNYTTGLTFENPAVSTQEPQTVSYVSSDTSIATVDANGKVSFNKAGTVTITATMAASTNYTESVTSYNVTVNTIPRTDFYFTTTAPLITYGDNGSEYINEVVNSENDGTITYSIISQKRDGQDVNDVASIDSTTGKLTILGSGTVEVKATVSKGHIYSAAEATYFLVINRAEQSGFAFNELSPADIAYGETYHNVAAGGESTGIVTYEIISGNEVVSLNGDGSINAIDIGEATIKATKAADNKYKAATAEYTIKVIKAEQTGFGFESNSYEVPYGTKTVTVGVGGGQSTGTVKYYITDGSEIADINENTGLVTFKSGKTNGSVTVKAVKEGDEHYNEADATMVINVTVFDASSQYTIRGNKGENDWYIGDLEIVPLDGYSISTSNGFDAKWEDKLTLEAEGITDYPQVYLKRNTGPNGGAISEPITIGTKKLDKSDPYNLDIFYSTSLVDYVWETLTFGYYNAPVTVTITATDDISGIDYFVYNLGQGDVIIPHDEIHFSENIATADFKIAPQYKGKVNITAYDVAGRSASKEAEKIIVVDDDSPVINVTYDNNDVVNDFYYKADRNATIKIAEDNFYADDVVITVGKRLNSETDYTYTRVTPEFSYDEAEGCYIATVAFNEDGDYTFDISYTDKSENESDDYEMDKFTVDKTSPVISADGVQDGMYYSVNEEDDEIVLNLTVVEHNFNAADIDFAIEAKDIQGNIVDLSEKNYEIYLQDMANWSKSGDTYTANITLDIEGNYSVKMTYSDMAGREQVTEVNIPFFCIDKSDPHSANITYSQSISDIILEMITLGFYKAPVTVTIEAVDDIAGVDYFTYSYDVKDGASSVNEGAGNVVIVSKNVDNKATATFSIPAQFRGYVSFAVTDKAGRDTTYMSSKEIVVDDKPPVISVSYDNNEAKYENYYNADRTATITINEANFYSSDVVIAVGKRLNNEEEYTETQINPEFVPGEDEDTYVATILFNEDADYTFDISYTDKSGNESVDYEMDAFTIDKTLPVINVSYDNNTCKNSDQFNADREAAIVITEHNFKASDVVGTVTINGTAMEEYTAYLSDDSHWSHNGDVHTAKIKYTDEAHYTFDIKCSDMSGNWNDGVNYGESAAPAKFTLDKTAPTELDIKIDDVSVAGSMETIAFDRFYSSAVTVKLFANCDISGVQSLQYQKVAAASAYNENGTWTNYDSNNGIVVSPSEKFIIYFRAEDRAGNVSIIRSTGIVVDNQKPVGETKAPEIDILPVRANANNLYKSDVKVDLKVVDPKFAGAEASANGHYSGLNKITYKIYTTDTGAVEEGTLLDLNSVMTGAVVDSDKLVSSWYGSIVIDAEKFNSNNVIVEIVATDNAGNSRTSTTNAGEIQIDITEPTIDISYSNNTADSNNIFKDDRTATIVVTERNFNAEDVKITLTNTDGVIPAVSAWTKTAGAGNMDNTTWTASITYDADGDYNFGIEYADMAENVCTGVQYGSSVAPTEFTIDKTVPVIDVYYDNNSVINDNYYKDVRTATIVITEHNFNADRVTINLTATDDGVASAIPAINGWKSNGDEHIATIYFGNDSKYTFDIFVTDKAGNDSADFTEQNFFVDKTAPALTITGVANNSANNGEVIPVISYYDTNYDAEQVTITLSGANRNNVELDGSYTDIHNGRIFTFNNFAEEKEIDDIYILTATLTDKAGNTTSETITFSVNRFGSTYALSEDAEELNDSYVQSPRDVVITETNANELTNIKITLFKNNETITLKEGEDYKIDVEGGDGEWYHYTYTIFKSNFVDDGVYRLTLHSEDTAGNIAENTLDTKNTEISFGVDKTEPNIIVTNLKSNTTYALENMTVSMSINDNLRLGSVTVYLDDYENAYKTWTAEEIAETIAENGEFTFDVAGDSTSAHKVKIVCVDAAGNEKIEEITDFFVTTNLFVRYYNNKPLFFGSITGVVVLTGLFVLLIIYKRKKQEDNK